MSVRLTSIEAYNRIKNEGLLSRRRFEVYEVLFMSGPSTAMELRTHFPKEYVDSQIRARLNELRELGAIEETGQRVCKITKQTVIEWAVTGSLPSEKAERLTSKQKINSLKSVVQDAVAVMRSHGLNEEANRYAIVLEGIES